MSPTGAIRCERLDEGVAELVIDRPAKLNALTSEMYLALAELLEWLSGEGALRCLILRGSGSRAFSAGSDIGEFAAAIGDRDRLLQAAEIGRRAGDALLGCRLPLVAAISGACFGGGLQFACACDLRIAAPTARFGIPIKAIGMRAELSDLEAMVRCLGPGLSLDLLLTGRALTAAEMAERGFLCRLAEDPLAEARAVARSIAQGAPQAALWHKKAVLALAGGGADAKAFAAEALDCYGSAEFAEGCLAFIEKRDPRFPPAGDRHDD